MKVQLEKKYVTTFHRMVNLNTFMRIYNIMIAFCYMSNANSVLL